ncbi:GIY-YIG nuclease family protein [Caldalkalibacillus mannanilyticus]|uniref:GIY-YIG nuclease family protein n=1 Tax=Caldalkalibacillus mannanilyticus TaxID=1418 RepID=UPI000468815B|nr:GIY-YIG nuclease family protein [Caldalkalibacillus mannanilyticus]
MSKHFVYIIQCKDHSLYTGYTNDIERRLHLHEIGKGAKYTRGRGPFQLKYVEEFEDKSTALRKEAEIKKLSTIQKRRLVEKGVHNHELEST